LKIRVQFILVMVMFGAVMLLIAASVAVTNRRVDRLNAHVALAEDIGRGVSDLGYLSNDYLLYGESEQHARWDSRWASHSRQLSELSPDTKEQKAIVEDIKRSHERLKVIFDNIAASVERKGGAVDDPAFFQVSWSRMTVQSQGILFDTSRLSRLLKSEADDVKRINSTLAVALLAIFLAFFITNYLLFARRTLRSLSELATAAGVIGSGNLESVIPVRSRDEIGDLTRAFNLMAVNLKGVTASKADLEREVSERRAAQDELHRQAAVRRGINRVFQGALSAQTEQQLGEMCLEVARDVTGSTFGFIGEIGPDALLHDVAMTKMSWKACSPSGHPPIESFIGAPLLVEGQTVGMIAMANREGGYGESELEALQALGPAILEVFQRKRAEDAVHASEERLRKIIDEVPIGITLANSTGVIVEMNDAVTAMLGVKPPEGDEIQEHDLFRALHHRTDRPLEPDEGPIARSLKTGQEVEELVDVVRPDGTRTALRLRSVPVLDPDGTIVRIIGITEDVTEVLRREHLDEALIRLTNSMSASLDIDEILRRLLISGTEAFGVETSVVCTRDDGHWVVRGTQGHSMSSPGDVVGDDQFETTMTAIEHRRPVAVDDTETDDREDKELMLRRGVRSFISIPLVTQRGVVGFARFEHHDRPIGFGAAHLEFASKLMSSASLALENALLYEREHRIADMLQAALLSPPEEIAGVQTAYIYRAASKAASIGGDFYDVFRINSDKVGILVGDVSGKGLEAAQLTSLVRNGIRSYAYENDDPRWVLERVNRLLARCSTSELFATLFFGVLSPATGDLHYCSGGHPPAIVASSDGTTSLLAATSPIVGAFEDVRFVADRSHLAPGDILVLYTDGLTEARRDHELFGEKRLLDAVRDLGGTPLDELPEALLRRVVAYSTDGLRDDTVVLCLRRLTDVVAA